ncbi:outer membrane lipoprotein carrier protein LolA [Acetobacter sp. AN02]|uniref:LolA family protein n=1 Tax=Acetobacter sp. AN02 TaxID=2894186 RepID=UPI0024344CBE|nr:outer membrane lipoprotein carrier protein LolA [Acetobacter sp. AN02]MDG6094638.1 outer membrane lipoprotein carrier protein LolA [Acetobacter sp. AN02]
MKRTRLSARLVLGTAALALSACAQPGSLGSLPPAERAAAERVQTSLNSITSLSRGFTQTWPGGGTGRGVMDYTPGHLHLSYTWPQGTDLQAGDGKLTFRDGTNGSVTHMGLSRNPLGLLLTTPIRLSGPVTVTSVLQSPGALQISLARSAMLSEGLLTLRFADNGQTLSLSGIEVVDERQHHISLALDP